LLEKEGSLENIRVIDFGTAKLFGEQKKKDGQTQLRDRVGTMAYIAPEILNLNLTGHHTEPDTFYNEKCDMWSIGVIAYMLLVGKNPFLAI
jgi:serine/threonine protein kinase|tara:strand:- start:3 stop:275 length:273 start_codon:yes stop_codon:yes gene_type:complete